MESDSDSSFATERSFEVEDFSPPSSPEVEVEEVNVEESGGPEPYMFEPMATGAASTDEPSEASVQHRMGPVTEWCLCGNCTSLSPEENVCCRETPKVMHRCQQAVYGTYLQLFGDMPETMVHSNYRHLAYRNVVRWCWGYLGQHIRVVIPSCAVTRIRLEFPDYVAYTGFLPVLNFHGQ
ncbi:unnamed protein product [Knipowitschia caucasica]